MSPEGKHLPNRGAQVASSLKTQALVGVVVVLAVSLLTFLFSFLGTITCGALIGMVFATTRHSKWQVALTALVFPLVSLTFSQLLTMDKSLVLAALCMGVFLVSYVLTSAGLYLERKQPAEPSQPRATISLPTVAPIDPNLKELQGTWTRQAVGHEGALSGETIRINQDRILITLPAPDGKCRTLFDGSLEVKRLGGYKLVSFIAGASNGCPILSRFGQGPCLCKIVGETLTIGWNFETAAPLATPEIESYRKAPAQASIARAQESASLCQR